MPKKPPRDNPRGRERRTVQSAASLLQRITLKTGIVPQAPDEAGALLERLRAALPAELRPHLTSVLQKSDELVCFVDGAAWAGRLKLAMAEQPGLADRRLTVRLMPPGGFRS